MSVRPLVIITTRLPPAVCGIGTHSWLLREHWPNESRPIEFLVIDHIATAPGLTTNDRLTSFHGQASALARELDRIGAADVLLHYAGRAYQRFGCPFWMPGVLRRWKGRSRDRRLMIFFHELPGESRVNSRHFWLGVASKWIIQRLCAVADVLVTNTEQHAAQLRKISSRADIHLLPVGSNIGTMPESAMPRARTEFVLFGLPFGRWQTLRLFEPHLRRWQASGRLTKLHLIGPQDDRFAILGDELLRTWAKPETVDRHGVLDSQDVGRLLRRVQFALSNVSEENWSKSGTFMACAANGCSVVLHDVHSARAPLANAIAAAEVETISDAELAERSAALAAWYEQNAAWTTTAARVASLWPADEASA